MTDNKRDGNANNYFQTIVALVVQSIVLASVYVAIHIFLCKIVESQKVISAINAISVFLLQVTLFYLISKRNNYRHYVTYEGIIRNGGNFRKNIILYSVGVLTFVIVCVVMFSSINVNWDGQRMFVYDFLLIIPIGSIQVRMYFEVAGMNSGEEFSGHNT